MMNRYEMLPKSIIVSAVPLAGLGISELAWDSDGVEELLEYLSCLNYPVLGGDVYKMKGGEILQTFDSWYVPNYSDCDDSYRKTRSFIQNYESNNDGRFLYSVIFDEAVRL